MESENVGCKARLILSLVNNSIDMEVVEENELNVLREIVNDEELAQIPRELTRKLNVHFNEKFEEFITAKAVFETNRKCLGKLNAPV